MRKIQIDEIDSYELFERIKSTIKEAVEEYLIEKGLSKVNSELGEYCTYEEACQFLKISKPTFRKLLEKSKKDGLEVEVKILGPRIKRFRTQDLPLLMKGGLK